MSEITWRARRYRRKRPREHITNIRSGYQREINGDVYSIKHPGIFLNTNQANQYIRTAKYRGVVAKIVSVVMGGKNVGFAVMERASTTRRIGRLSSRRKRLPSPIK